MRISFFPNLFSSSTPEHIQIITRKFNTSINSNPNSISSYHIFSRTIFCNKSTILISNRFQLIFVFHWKIFCNTINPLFHFPLESLTRSSPSIFKSLRKNSTLSILIPIVMFSILNKTLLKFANDTFHCPLFFPWNLCWLYSNHENSLLAKIIILVLSNLTL